MFLEIELLYFVLMIATFVVLLLFAKLPSGLCLMASAVVGAIAYTIVAAVGGSAPSAIDLLRYLSEGTFGYLDTILVIVTAMVFMGAMQISGALEYISALLVRTFRRVPSVLLILLMLIIMFPAMVTGSSLTSAITTGAMVAPIMIKWGIPKNRVGAIVAVGAILGMVAPPINVPAMVICDVVDIPYVDFTLPLLMISVPAAIVCVLILGRKYVKALTKEEVEYVVDTSVLKELNWTVCIPMLVLIVLIVGEIVFPKIFGSVAMPAFFVVSTAIAFFVGRRLPFWKKQPENRPKHAKPNCVVDVIRQSVHKSFGAMGLLMGVGMFMEIITLNGVRGYFALNASALYYAVNPIVGYISMALTLPIFGGVSAFGSASVLGGPFVMMLNGIGDNVIVTCGLSLLAAIGEFLPPTAMSATLAAHMMGEKKWTKITKSALPAVGVLFGYSLLYTILFGQLVENDVSGNMTMILFFITLGAAILFAIIWEVLVRTVPFFKKAAYQVVSSENQKESEQIISEAVLEAAEEGNVFIPPEEEPEENSIAEIREKTDENDKEEK